MINGLLAWISSTSLCLGGAVVDAPPPEPPSVHHAATEGEPPTEEPPPAEASAAVRAQQHFQAGDWNAAIDALMEAYAADPDPAYLYARAQAERMRGNCRAAIALYQRFLDSGPTDQQRADTQRHIRLCEEILFNAQVEGEPEPEPEPEVERPEEHELPTREDGTRVRPWQRDPLGLVLVVAGTTTLAGGATSWVLGDRHRRAAPIATTEDLYDSHVARARLRIALGASLVGLGIVAVGLGAARLATLAGRARVAAVPWWQPGAGGMGVWARF